MRHALKASLSFLFVVAMAASPAMARDHDRDNDRDRDNGRYGYQNRDGRDDGRYDSRGRGHDRGNHYGRDDRYYRPAPRVVYRPYRPAYQAGYRPVYQPVYVQPRWARGARYYDTGYGPSYAVADYRGYGLRAPPRGHYWRRSDAGDYLLVAVATGIITDLILRH